MSKETDEDDAMWDVESVLAERLDVKIWISKNIVRLLEQSHTIPFIARYRKEKTDNMDVPKLRDIKALYEDLLAVQAKISFVIKTIRKLGKLTKDLKTALRCAETLAEVETLYLPYKGGSKRHYAERAKDLGLEPLALDVLYNTTAAGKGGKAVNIQDYVKPSTQGLSTLTEVETGVKHIIADVIHKTKETAETIRQLCKRNGISISSARRKQVDKKAKDTDMSKAHKYELYFSFSSFVKLLKPHQILAINRGESQKILTVKINIPDVIKESYVSFCEKKWLKASLPMFAQLIISRSTEDAYIRLIQPTIIRHTRSELTKTAEKVSIEVFQSNLKRLLLTPPVRGKVVLGVDPGFTKGCKCAVIKPNGDPLDTFVLFIHNSKHQQKLEETKRLKNIILKHRCETVAIGNGTACRETEAFFSDLITKGTFEPLNLKFCIVRECSSSIYSVSDVAQQELPDMDPILRSAVSIARRLQDPLVELVKVEPKHIGVGMYQHDVPENQMKIAVDETVSECVSFVGVNLNYCTETLLRRVAGITSAMAKKVIAWREKNGPFVNREQLKVIKGLGPKTYEQCAGFVKIYRHSLQAEPPVEPGETGETPHQNEHKINGEPSTNGRKRKANTTKLKTPSSKRAKVDQLLSVPLNLLDSTVIHPESYQITQKLLKKVDGEVSNIGQPSLSRKLNQLTDLDSLAVELNTGKPTLEFIIEALKAPIDSDIRNEYDKPVFKQGLLSIHDIKVGQKLTGKVDNVTHFGAFVDIGVGRDGLIHTSKMNRQTLELGDSVTVVVINIDNHKTRIGLKLLEKESRTEHK